MGGVEGIAAALRTDLKDGLFADELDQDPNLSKRKTAFGENFIEKPPLRSFWSHCWEQLQDPMLIVLVIAGFISIVVGSIDGEGMSYSKRLFAVYQAYPGCHGLFS